MEFDFTSDNSNRPKRGPPKRFLMRNAPSQATTVKEAPKSTETKEGIMIFCKLIVVVESAICRRFPPVIPCKDGSIAYTKELAIETVNIFNLC